jgi:hypothetical protein
LRATPLPLAHRNLRGDAISMKKTNRTAIGVVVGGVVSVVVTAIVLVASSVAGNAIPQSNPSFPTVACGGEWHWVHNQLPAGTTGGTLTATFENLGTVQITGVLNPAGTTLHYRITLDEGDTLISASDDVSGGRLLLSNFPSCETTSPPPSSSSPPPSSSSPPPSTSGS